MSGGDLEKVKEGLKEGKGLPTAQGDFDGKGETDAEKEATEVPEKEGEDGEKPEEGDKKPKDKGDKSKDKGDKSKDKGDDSKDKGDESKDKGDKSKDKGDESKDKGSKDKDGTKKPNKGEEPDPGKSYLLMLRRSTRMVAVLPKPAALIFCLPISPITFDCIRIVYKNNNYKCNK